MKKRFLACGLCALMLLSAVRASAVRGEDVFHDDSVVRSVTTVVYCLSEDRYRLVPEVRTIQILGCCVLSVFNGLLVDLNHALRFQVAFA